ncbi:MAG: IS110 family transposase [Myxococcaceae bacterium]
MVRFAGVDIASEKHVVAVVDASGGVLVKPKSFGEDAAGYEALFTLLGEPEGLLVAMEATGHYWKNLFAALAARGYLVALINPVRTNRFAAEDMQRTKTDAIDALGIACFAAQKKPVPTRLPDTATEELRELVRLRDRLVQDFGDRVRQLHRLVDLGFPEFTRYVRSLDSELASSILKDYPTAEAFLGVRPRALSNLKYDGVHFVGLELANQLIAAAKTSVGRHHGYAYRVQVKYFCEDLDITRRRIKQLDRNIDSKLEQHEVGKLLITIDGIGNNTAARLIAVLGDPAHFRDARALASYVGAVPALKHSGKKTPSRAGLTHLGNAELRTALYMPTLSAVRRNPWLRAFYERLRARGKLPKVALLAAMRKLLTAIYSVAKHRRPFIPNLLAVEAPS